MLREEVEIAAPAGQVWDFVTDWPRQATWVPLTRVRVARGGGHELGAGLAAWTGVGPLGFLDPMTITHWEPPRRMEMLHTGRLVRGEAGFTLTPLGPDRCRIAWWERLVVPGGPVGALAWRLAGPVASLSLRRVLGRLRRAVEQQPT
ncbi:MAG: SRPBCC family protein [Actinomycetota bacterium]|nr:SRPBCC family protein [Actinomycetota bacterium]